jgi:hypothetical protein
MVERKETPDVLADLLSDAPAVAPSPAATAPVNKVLDLPTRRSPRPKTEPSPVPPPAPAPEPVQPVAWEYELVSCQDYHGWRPRFVNGKELPAWMKGPLIEDYLNMRGAEGWELTAATNGQTMYGAADRVQLYFKRVKQ